MNQILMVEDKKKKKKNKSGSSTIEIANIVRFFAVVLIIFGIFYIGQGSYAMYKESKGRNTENMPIVNIKRINDSVKVTVDGINTIQNLKYSWNDTEETTIPVENTYVEEDILLPMQNSILNVWVEEENGRVIKYHKEFIIEGLDITQPDIEIKEENTEGSIRIIATDETSMSYITYKINEENEVRIDKSEVEDKTINYILKLERGENKVVITAVDESGNIGTLEKTIIVSGKTKISNLKIENGKLMITAEDPDGIKDIEINLNGVVRSKKDINQKKVTASLALAQGNNTLKITITNVNSLVTVATKEFNYVQ